MRLSFPTPTSLDYWSSGHVRYTKYRIGDADTEKCRPKYGMHGSTPAARGMPLKSVSFPECRLFPKSVSRTTLPRPCNAGGKCVCVYLCVCVFIKLHVTTQSGLVILLIICSSH